MDESAIKKGRPKKGKCAFTEIFYKLIGSETQQQSADKIGVARQNIGKWTSGETTPDIVTLGKIADAYNVSTDYLLGRTTVKSPSVELTEVCNYTGLSEKSVENLRAIKDHQLNANLLIEKNNFEDIVEHLCEIERLEIAKKYYDLVINPISNGDEFYDNLILNDVKLCKFRCDGFVKACPKYKQECGKCNIGFKEFDDKDYIHRLIQEVFDKSLSSEFGALFTLCPDWLSDEYKDKSDLEEFKLTKAAAEIVTNTKENSDHSTYFIEKNKSVRKYLIEELQKSEYLLKVTEDCKEDYDYDKFTELIVGIKADITAIQTFLEKYDENFKLKREGE